VYFKAVRKDHGGLTHVNLYCRMSRSISRSKASYRLKHIQDLIRQGKYLIKDNAVALADSDFGWTGSEIIDVMCRLKPKHFRKTEDSKILPGVMIDYYGAHKMRGEKVYLHFYVAYEGSDERVVINSFHRLEE